MTQCLSRTIPVPLWNLEMLNQRFSNAHPREILVWALANMPSGLVQTTSFGANGMVILDLLYRDLQPDPPVPVLFLDTLHHFPETLELVVRAEATYGLDLKIYRPAEVSSRTEFADRYGEMLWEQDIETFHALTRLEPLERGLQDLGATAWITGRRRDEASTRGDMAILELDRQGRLKINPLANWTQRQVWTYIVNHGVLYNPLYDRGYSSIGDEPTTTPTQAGEAERAGRWRGLDKTECGIHLYL